MLDMLPRLSAALADRYVIERQIGSGGMATVYLARELKHDREVALKVLRPEIAAQLGAERFLKEIKITARLDHPHILTLIDSGESDGFLWYVQPYIRGESLRARLLREKQLGVDDAINIARQIAGALEHAHHHGVIHRDIKPENILLHEGEAMVADFGIALALSEAADPRLTETGFSLGSPQYMSPEQATGERHLDGRSDVYALGAVLYEMLAGVAPHTGQTSQAIISKLLTERPTPLRAIRGTVPPAVESAVARALEKTPADRFPSAAAFAVALQGSVPVHRAEPASRRLRVALMALAAALALAAAYLLLRPSPTLAIGRSEQITAEPGLEIQPALSPDGQLVAYAAGTAGHMRIFIRPVAGGGGRTIPLSDDSTAVETHPRWSPDGSRLLFLTRGGAAGASCSPLSGHPTGSKSASSGPIRCSSFPLTAARPGRSAEARTSIRATGRRAANGSSARRRTASPHCPARRSAISRRARFCCFRYAVVNRYGSPSRPGRTRVRCSRPTACDCSSSPIATVRAMCMSRRCRPQASRAASRCDCRPAWALPRSRYRRMGGAWPMRPTRRAPTSGRYPFPQALP